MSQIPDDLRYTPEHEWARPESGDVRVGITDFAQASLGDVVFVDLPSVGTRVHAGQAFGEIESTKSVSDLLAPVDGHVTAVNDALGDDPGLVNREPYAGGWLCVLRTTDDLSSLLPATDYRRLLGEGQ